MILELCGDPVQLGTSSSPSWPQLNWAQGCMGECLGSTRPSWEENPLHEAGSSRAPDWQANIGTFSGGSSGGDGPRPLSERMRKFIWK